MISIRITDIKGFMQHLLKYETFDSFEMVTCLVATFFSCTMDGRIQKDYFDIDEQALLAEKKQLYIPWKNVKNYCYTLIRGKKLPVSFKISLRLNERQQRMLAEQSGAKEDAGAVNGFILNIIYKDRKLICTTGISWALFSLDKTMEFAWEQFVLAFFKKNQMEFELI